MLLPPFEWPQSEYLSERSRQSQHWYAKAMARHYQALEAAGLNVPLRGRQDIAEIRLAQAALFYQSDVYQYLLSHYPVSIRGTQLDDVPVEIFSPAEGISEQNRPRVLINLFGGNFEVGTRTASHTESIPVAALGKIKVISVDYRLAPEHQFPAASDDVVKVYRELLKQYRPENIGIFGTSAGARLAAQVLAQLQQAALPTPGAVAMIAWSASERWGDSMAVGGAYMKASVGFDLHSARIEYLENADPNNPLVTPGVSDQVMAQFPPSMLAASSRDWLLSSVTACHRQLCRLGVPAELHCWDGLEHNFHANPALPESTELHQTTVDFFARYLGRIQGED